MVVPSHSCASARRGGNVIAAHSLAVTRYAWHGQQSLRGGSHRRERRAPQLRVARGAHSVSLARVCSSTPRHAIQQGRSFEWRVGTAHAVIGAWCVSGTAWPTRARAPRHTDSRGLSTWWARGRAKGIDVQVRAGGAGRGSLLTGAVSAVAAVAAVSLAVRHEWQKRKGNNCPGVLSTVGRSHVSQRVP